MASPGPVRAVVLRASRVPAAVAALLLLLGPAAPAAPEVPEVPEVLTVHAAPPARAAVPVVPEPVVPVPVSTPAVATPTPVPTPPRPAIETVAPARPVGFAFQGLGIDVRARVCAMPNALDLNPPGDPRRQVCWVEAPMGEKPGSRSATTYILGHSYADDPHTVLAQVSRLASAQLARARTVYRSGVPTRTITALAGSTLTLWTRNGVLTYRVGTTFAVPKPQFGLVQRIEDDTLPRRVVLVTCAVHGGRDLDYNVIVEAKLVAAHPTR